MTALFENTVVIPPTSTAQPAPTLAVVTATLAPPPASTATLPPAPTSTATLPPTPTRTSLPINMRNGPSASAAFLSKAPVIDGPWSEWDTRAFNADHVVFGKSSHTGGEDLGASYRVGWDNTYLYLAVKVYDDSFVQNASGASMFKGNSVEILLDTNVIGDFYSDVLSGDDFQLGISAGKGALGQNMEAYLWYPSGKAGAVSRGKDGRRKITGIYRLEAAIQLDSFRGCAIQWHALRVCTSRF